MKHDRPPQRRTLLRSPQLMPTGRMCVRCATALCSAFCDRCRADNVGPRAGLLRVPTKPEWQRPRLWHPQPRQLQNGMSTAEASGGQPPRQSIRLPTRFCLRSSCPGRSLAVQTSGKQLRHQGSDGLISALSCSIDGSTARPSPKHATIGLDADKRQPSCCRLRRHFGGAVPEGVQSRVSGRGALGRQERVAARASRS